MELLAYAFGVCAIATAALVLKCVEERGDDLRATCQRTRLGGQKVEERIVRVMVKAK